MKPNHFTETKYFPVPFRSADNANSGLLICKRSIKTVRLNCLPLNAKLIWKNVAE